MLNSQIEDLETAASLDALSGLANRRAFDESLNRVVLESIRSYTRIGLVLLDVDDFKGVNDAAGHAAGNEVVAQVARVIARQARRPMDLCARIGGDEFAVLLVGCGYHAAIERATAVRHAIEEAGIEHPSSPLGRVSVSIGVAAGRADDVRFGAALFRSADGALYEAKRRGKARVCGARSLTG